MEKPVTGTLFDTLNQDKRFRVPAYHVVSFGTLPSCLRFSAFTDRTRAFVDEIIACLDLDRFSFETVFKNWSTEDFKNALPTDDYPFEYVFKSESGQMIVHLNAREGFVTIDFYYNVDRADCEQWILETNQNLRSKFGPIKQPKFKVLMQQEGMFGTEDVNTNDFEAINLAEFYNDDFLEIDATISDFMAKKESGIILLHGEPGTGKTTYIKNLISRFHDKNFIFVQNDFVRDLLKPSFVSFLLQNKNATLIIEDAEKVVVSRDNVSEDSVVSTILQLTDGLFSDFLNIKIICTFNTDIERIDKALMRKGRMIAKYNFTALSAEKTAALAKKLGHEDVKGSLTLADIFEFDKRDYKDQNKRGIGFV